MGKLYLMYLKGLINYPLASARRTSRILLKIRGTSCLFSHSSTSASLCLIQNPKLERIQLSNGVSFSYTRNSNLCIARLGRQGRIKEARKILDEMLQKDVVSYASMITIYLKNKQLSNAEKLYYEMPIGNIVADSAMIDGYAKAHRMEDASQIFSKMRQKNVYSWTSLISGYLRIGETQKARHFFDQMPEKNVVSWTTMILGLARNSLIGDARKFFDRMPEKNVVAWTTMIKSYVENNQIDEAIKLFKEMPERNLFSWNIMISAYLDHKRVDEAVHLFKLMPVRNAISWTTMLTGLARNGLTCIARQYFDKMPVKDVAAWNSMITSYMNDGLTKEASELFSLMPERNIVTWNAMIDGYSSNGFEQEALEHLVLMLRSGNRPNETTMTSFVIASDQSIVELMEAHALIIFLGLEADATLLNALFTMYSRNGDIISAQLAFENHKAKDIVSWTAMIQAYSNHGMGHHALHIFSRMLRAGFKPDDITFVGVLSACSHTVGLVNKGLRLFRSMSQGYGLEPKPEHFSCIIDILGRSGNVKEALKLGNRLLPTQRDKHVMGALLSACRLSGNVKMANQLGEELIEMEPDSSGVYMLLANVYAAGGKWVDFASIRKRMKERKVSKVPGFSQITVKNKRHMFFSGDKLHPELKIYVLCWWRSFYLR
ncbi:hypothetical protein Sjap_015073 [Stephania japonica]|uniref:Pentatricopeptide repeat-containing protein n=1 Tax=Stephania japonica TaxID=461633 RepID=A0AAP0NTM9_9MAGN